MEAQETRATKLWARTGTAAKTIRLWNRHKDEDESEKEAKTIRLCNRHKDNDGSKVQPQRKACSSMVYPSLLMVWWAIIIFYKINTIVWFEFFVW